MYFEKRIVEYVFAESRRPFLAGAFNEIAVEASSPERLSKVEVSLARSRIFLSC